MSANDKRDDVKFLPSDEINATRAPATPHSQTQGGRESAHDVLGYRL